MKTVFILLILPLLLQGCTVIQKGISRTSRTLDDLGDGVVERLEVIALARDALDEDTCVTGRTWFEPKVGVQVELTYDCMYIVTNSQGRRYLFFDEIRYDGFLVSGGVEPYAIPIDERNSEAN